MNVYDQYRERVLLWADKRGLLENDIRSIERQSMKLCEEVGEFHGALLKENYPKILDALGDIQVVVFILHAKLGLLPETTLEGVLNIIEQRTGETIDGVFRKTESVDRA